jgi:hypothetical protein
MGPLRHVKPSVGFEERHELFCQVLEGALAGVLAVVGGGSWL